MITIALLLLSTVAQADGQKTEYANCRPALKCDLTNEATQDASLEVGEDSESGHESIGAVDRGFFYIPDNRKTTVNTTINGRDYTADNCMAGDKDPPTEDTSKYLLKVTATRNGNDFKLDVTGEGKSSTFGLRVYNGNKPVESLVIKDSTSSSKSSVTAEYRLVAEVTGAPAGRGENFVTVSDENGKQFKCVDAPWLAGSRFNAKISCTLTRNPNMDRVEGCRARSPQSQSVASPASKGASTRKAQ